MPKIICPNCGSCKITELLVYLFDGSHRYRCDSCGQNGSDKDFIAYSTLEQITASKEILAGKLVYSFADYDRKGVYWKSTIINNKDWSTRKDAIRATIKELETFQHNSK
jgi:transposase-like protein